jgi:hypothetical protein
MAQLLCALEDGTEPEISGRDNLKTMALVEACYGLGGGVWTVLASRGPVGPLNIAVGVVAFGMLGGMASFATVAFIQVLLGAIWQTVKTPPRESASDGSL